MRHANRLAKLEHRLSALRPNPEDGPLIGTRTLVGWIMSDRVTFELARDCVDWGDPTIADLDSASSPYPLLAAHLEALRKASLAASQAITDYHRR